MNESLETLVNQSTSTDTTTPLPPVDPAHVLKTPMEEPPVKRSYLGKLYDALPSKKDVVHSAYVVPLSALIGCPLAGLLHTQIFGNPSEHSLSALLVVPGALAISEGARRLNMATDYLFKQKNPTETLSPQHVGILLPATVTGAIPYMVGTQLSAPVIEMGKSLMQYLS